MTIASTNPAMMVPGIEVSGFMGYSLKLVYIAAIAGLNKR